MPISKETIKKFQDLYEEKYGKKLTNQEAYEGASNLVNFFDLLLKLDYKDRQRKEKLKQYPKGFHLMDGGTYNCGICHGDISNEQTWYDKWGIKCLACQKAINKKIISGKICYNDKLWYKMWELESYFKLKSPTVRKLVRQGILKARIIPDTNFYVFMISDNINVLPPKELIKNITVQIDDKIFSIHQWYEHKNPEEILKNYKIWPYLLALHK